MFKLQTITVLICATTVLTLSVTKSTTDGSSKESHVDSTEHFHDPGGIHSSSKVISNTEKNLTNDNTHAAVTMEVTGVSQSKAPRTSPIVPKTAPIATVVAEGIKLTSEELVPLDTKSKLPKTRNASIVARKGAIPTSKISPRKGVGLESSIPTETSMEGIDEAVHSRVSSSVKLSSKKDEKISTKTDERNATKKEATEKKLAPEHISIPITTNNNNNSTIKMNSSTSEISENVSSTTETKIPDVISSTSSPKHFKPKPTVTIGEMDIDKPIPASPTKSPPLGMPRKIDYIVPVIITIMSVPLLGGMAFFLYRRGRDCWDKRHYRRMDFLIDGMYNDYSWK